MREKEDPRRNAVVAGTTGKTDWLSHEPGSLQEELVWEGGRQGRSELAFEDVGF